ncbi:MAG: hypothetical protein ACLR6O_01325 [Eubacterium sp.]
MISAAFLMKKLLILRLPQQQTQTELNNMKLNGLIVKGIGGFYYVETADGLYECKARGVFRKKRITPLVGDKVSISVNTNAENTIDDIFERKNSLVRPPLANIDTLFIVSSIVDLKLTPLFLIGLLPLPNIKTLSRLLFLQKPTWKMPMINMLIFILKQVLKQLSAIIKTA